MKIKSLFKKTIIIECILLIISFSGFTLAMAASKELNISVMYNSRYLDLAVEKFNKLHPDVKVNVKESVASPENAGGKNTVIIRNRQDPKDTEKYVNDVSTDLISGKGSDIISLNNLPYQRYIEKNLLANLSSLMSSDKSFNKSKYYTNILDALKFNDNLYALPLSATINILTADKTNLSSASVKINDSTWTWNDFVKAAQQVIDISRKKGVQGMTALNGMNENTLLNLLVQSSYNKFVDTKNKKVNFNSKEFIDLLNKCKYMLDNKLMDTDTTQGKIMEMSMRGNSVFNALTLNTILDFSIAKMSSPNPVYLKYPGQGSGLSFSSSTLYGINNNSKNKALAWEFMKILLSDDVQSDMSLIGAPVNKTASEKRGNNMLVKNKNAKRPGMLMIGTPDSKQTIQLKPITQADINAMNSLVKMANKYTEEDQTIMGIIQEEAQSFLTGQKSAEDTVKNIQGRTSTYINE